VVAHQRVGDETELVAVADCGEGVEEDLAVEVVQEEEARVARLAGDV